MIWFFLFVEVHALVTCSAAGPWGMIGFIEGIMAEQAKTGMMLFFDFCKKEVVQNVQIRGSMRHRRSDDYFDTQDAVSESSFAGALHKLVNLIVTATFCYKVQGTVSLNCEQLLVQDNSSHLCMIIHHTLTL